MSYIETGDDRSFSRANQDRRRIDILEEKVNKMKTYLSKPYCDIQRNTLCINDLIDRVKCSAIGHKFKLVAVRDDIIKNKPDCIIGCFVCNKCGLRIERPLTKTEIKAAKQLNVSL